MQPVPMKKSLYLGIDAGGSGGIALIGNIDPYILAMPKSYKTLFEVLDGIDRECFCIIEKVGGYIGGPSPGSAMFKFGQSYGALLMALTGTSITFEEVVPQRWQKGLHIPKRYEYESKNDFKKRLKIKAEQLFPKVDGITLKTCDALLIAEFARRYREGKL